MIEKLVPSHDPRPLGPSELKRHETKTENPSAAITRIEARLEYVPVKRYVLIRFTPSTSFEEFQRMLQQHWLRHYCIQYEVAVSWSTWLHCNGSPKIFMAESNWTEVRQRILDLTESRTLAWENGDAELITRIADTSSIDVWIAKDQKELKAMLLVHESMERDLVVQGRHLPPPRHTGGLDCCVM